MATARPCWTWTGPRRTAPPVTEPPAGARTRDAAGRHPDRRGRRGRVALGTAIALLLRGGAWGAVTLATGSRGRRDRAAPTRHPAIVVTGTAGGTSAGTVTGTVTGTSAAPTQTVGATCGRLLDRTGKALADDEDLRLNVLGSVGGSGGNSGLQRVLEDDLAGASGVVVAVVQASYGDPVRVVAFFPGRPG